MSFAAQDEARRVRRRDSLPVLIGDFALDVPHVPAPIGDARLGAQVRFPDRTEEGDVERDRSEAFVRGQRRSERHSHRRIGEIAEYAPVQCAHRIGVLRPCLHRAYCPAFSDSLDDKTNQLGDRRFIGEYFLNQRVRGSGWIRHAFEVAFTGKLT